MTSGSGLPLRLRMNISDCTKASLSLEKELRLALRRAKSAAGSQYGKVWRLNSSEVSSAARQLAASCRKALEAKRV